MGLIITSRSSARRHGVYAELRVPPAIVRPDGSGVVCVVEQFPWGPEQTLTTPDTTSEAIKMFAPFGSNHLSAGYLSIIQKGFPLLKFVRVAAATGTAAATATVSKTGPTSMLTLTLKYTGTMGNSCTWQTTAASDGDTNHFNLIVQLTGASGTTTDKLENLNYSGTGTDSAPVFTSLALLGGITKLASGVPLVASGSFTGGLDGTVAAADYVGTEGTGNKGFAQMEGDPTIRHFFTGDPGSSFRAVVNAGAYAHAIFMSDRHAYLNGDSGQSSAAARTDAANYSSQYVSYVDSWVYIYDDVTGAKRLVPPAPFLASVASQLSPSTSPAWKSSEVGALLRGIVQLEADRGQGAATNTDGGVCTLMKEITGGFRFEAAVNTCAPADPSRKRMTWTSMAIYLAASLSASFRPFVDGPNVPLTQQAMIDATVDFLETLKTNRDIDPAHKVYIIDYDIPDLEGFNSNSDLQNGDFTLPLDVTIDPGMERIFLSFNLKTGTVTAA